MGLSFLNEGTIILNQPEPEFVERLKTPGLRVPSSHYSGDAPIWVERVSEDGTEVVVSSQGYGVFDFSEMDLPESLNGIISVVRSCQSQDIDYVISADSMEMETGFDWSPYENEREDDYFNFQSQSPDIDWDLPDEEIDRLDEEWETKKDRLVEMEFQRHRNFFPESKVLLTA